MMSAINAEQINVPTRVNTVTTSRDKLAFFNSGRFFAREHPTYACTGVVSAMKFTFITQELMNSEPGINPGIVRKHPNKTTYAMAGILKGRYFLQIKPIITIPKSISIPGIASTMGIREYTPVLLPIMINCPNNAIIAVIVAIPV